MRLPDEMIEAQKARDLASLIFGHYEASADRTPRPHMGASRLGHKCARAVWYGWRWCTPALTTPPIEGRILRLFETGEREEARVVENLRAVGVRLVTTADGFTAATGRTCRARTGAGPVGQISFSDVHGHVGGSLDGYVLGGVPEAPASEHVLEIKTANDSSWSKIAREGVEAAKPEHAVQMQLYMRWSKAQRALYVCVNKNNDKLHIERIRYSATAAKAALSLAEQLIVAESPPPRITNDPGGWTCRYCDHKPVCDGVAAPLRSCRTCTHATPVLDSHDDGGMWRCDRDGVHAPIPLARQRVGCGWHLFHPEIIAPEGGALAYRTSVGSGDDLVAHVYADRAGREVRNVVSPTRPIVVEGGVARLERALVRQDLRRAVDGGLSAEAMALALPHMADGSEAAYTALTRTLSGRPDCAPEEAFDALTRALEAER